MIITENEAPVYLPEMADLPSHALQLAIDQAEGIATGASGSRRKLDLRSHKEICAVNDAGLISLKSWPIDLTRPVSARFREFASRGGTGLSQWQNLADDQFEIDDQGNMTLFISFASDFGRRARSARPMATRLRREVEVEYWAGFDFRADLSAIETLPAGPERDRLEQIREIKSALAGIISLRQVALDSLNTAATGASLSAIQESGLESIPATIKRIQAHESYLVDFEDGRGNTERATMAQKVASSEAASGSLMEELLIVFRKYQAHRQPV